MPNHTPPKEIPLKVLICDRDQTSDNKLQALLMADHSVILSTDRVSSIKDCENYLQKHEVNTIFIDPFSFGLDSASEFIFDIRIRLPEICFVLYVDYARLERHRSSFFRGERNRFLHYYRLNKRNEETGMSEELRAVIPLCQDDLKWRLSASTIERLRNQVSPDLRKEVDNALGHLRSARTTTIKIEPEPNSVFISYAFKDKKIFEQLKVLVESKGLKVVTGERALESISQAIFDRIKRAKCFVSIMTKGDKKENGKYTTSAWLLEEKGAR